jgi:hypothetical protein
MPLAHDAGERSPGLASVFNWSINRSLPENKVPIKRRSSGHQRSFKHLQKYKEWEGERGREKETGWGPYSMKPGIMNWIKWIAMIHVCMKIGVGFFFIAYFVSSFFVFALAWCGV